MTMFSAARCFVPALHPHPHPRYAGIPCTRPSHRAPAPASVSAKPRRRGSGSTGGPSRDSSWDDAIGDSDRDARIDADFFGQELDDDDMDEEEEPPPPTYRRAASPEPQLRGTDVLRALQRAAAAKAEAAKKKRKDKKPAARQRQRKEKHEGGGEVALAGEVRPVVIKPEWAPRIQELEIRVRQLADKYYHQ